MRDVRLNPSIALSGAAKAKPGRYASRTNPAQLPSIGYAPRYLTKEQRLIWRQLVRLAPSGLLTIADTFAVEVAVRLLHRSRTPYIMKASDVAVLTSLLGKLGLTPADRARLDIPAPQPTAEENGFDEF